jgi:hypothetical protein
MISNSRHRATYKYHQTWGFWYRPHLYTRVLGPDGAYLLRTNSLGARCDREPDSSPTARCAALIVGCSFAAGDGVSNDVRFSDRLERLDHGLACHNYALSGSGHDQQLLIHRTFAPALRPDVLIVAPVVGCIVRNLAASKVSYDPFTRQLVARAKPYFTLEEGTLRLHNSPVPHAVTAVADAVPSPDRRARLRAALPGWMLTAWRAARLEYRRRLERYLVEYDDPGGGAYRLTHAILRHLLDESSAAHKLLVPLPGREYVTTARRPNYLPLYRDVAAATGAVCVDVLPSFRSSPRAERARFFLPYDGHYSPEGHRVVAETLARALG